MSLKSDVWLKMSDPKLTQVELMVDVYDVEEKAQERIKQLRRQRRRAIRRAMSLAEVLKRLIDAAQHGTADQIEKVFTDARLILNVPLHEALKDMKDD